MSSPLHVLFWFVRASEAHDPHAFVFQPEKYRVYDERNVLSPEREVPWSVRLLEQLGELHTPSPPPELLERLGDRLRTLVEPAGWVHRARQIIDAQSEGRVVVVTIRSSAAELYALPWELLTIPDTGEHLGALDHVLVRYEWPGTRSTPSLVDTDRTRIVVTCSGDVPASEHVDCIRSAASATSVEVEVIPNATFGALADALGRDGPPVRALHLLCHGVVRNGTYGLLLSGRDASGEVFVEPGKLQRLLSPHSETLRLVVLASCGSGNCGVPGSYTGSLALRVHRAGVQCVVASRYPLSIPGSTRMTREFYDALFGSGCSIESAFLAARAALVRDPTYHDWAGLQLYARVEDGHDSRLFRCEASEQFNVLGVPDLKEASRRPSLDVPLRRRLLAALQRRTPSQFGNLLVILGLHTSPHISPPSASLAIRAVELMTLIEQAPGLVDVLCDELGIIRR